ncbi:MAG: ABC transporter permease [Oscillospiraceae bacterium]|nr:ABC transporter permease [Oscillospiraceae bacterium]
MTLKYILKRVGVFVVTLFVISTLAFIAFSIIPGDPVTRMLGMNASEERIVEMRSELGLDKPIHTRFFKWLQSFVTGDFGKSYSYSIPVRELLSDKVLTTASLSLMAFVFVLAISMPLGLLLSRYSIISSKGAKSSFQRAIISAATALNQIIMSIPPFFTGIIITYVFGLILRFFTPGAFVPYSGNPAAFYAYLIFPALSIALPRSAMVIKLIRGSVLNEAGSDYVRTAYSRGGGQWYVLLVHIMRNALIPVINFLAMTLSDIVAGSIIIEQVFAIPGMGRLLLLSISNRDYPVVQTIVVIIASVVVILNLLADVICQYIDPRIRIT